MREDWPEESVWLVFPGQVNEEKKEVIWGIEVRFD